MDELFELRNYFYLGNHAAATTEGETLSLDDQGAQIERDVILKRIKLAEGKFDEVIASVDDSSHIALQAVGLLARFLKDPSTAETARAGVIAWLDDSVASASDSLVLMCAIILATLGDFDQALRATSRCQGLEHRALKVQTLLQIDRVDMADKEAEKMRRIDEDATLSQLATAWVNLSKGGTDAQEALYVYRDLLERHGSTDTILNGMALSHLAMGNPVDAERVLQEALSKNPNFACTLVNVIACSKHINKPPELVARYMERLDQVAPTCNWIQSYKTKEQEFDRVAAALTSSQ